MTRFCMRCGAPLESGKRFCTNCGSLAGLVSDDGRDADGRKRRRENRSRGGLALGIASLAVAFLVIGAGAFILASGGIDEAIARIIPQPDDERITKSAEYGSLSSVEVASSTALFRKTLRTLPPPIVRESSRQVHHLATSLQSMTCPFFL